MKNRLKTRGASLGEVHQGGHETDEVIGKMKVSALLEALPGVGKVRARQIMEEIGIAETPPGARPGQPTRCAALESSEFGATPA